MDMSKPRTVDEYIANSPKDIQPKLRQMRQIIRKIAPTAEEKISYGIPYYSLNGRLAYFAHFKGHLSLVVMSSGIRNFEVELKGYNVGKGTIQFANDKPLPASLIKKIVVYRAKENLAKGR